MIPELKPADIILTVSDSLTSKIIRFFGKMQTGDCKVSHSALALGSLTLQPEAIESLWKVTRSPIKKYEGQKIIIFRMKHLHNELIRNEIALKCISVERQAYGLLKLPLFALDSLTRSYFFTRYFGISNFKVCSNLIAWAYENILGFKPFGAGWRSVSPDIIFDNCWNKSEWEVVYDAL